MKKDVAQRSYWRTFTADVSRYVDPDLRPWSRRFIIQAAKQAHMHPGLLAVGIYRYGQWVRFGCRFAPLRLFHEFWYLYWYNWVRTRLQIELPRNAQIGPGLRIHHYSGIIIHSELVAGANLSLSSSILVGETDRGVPRFGDNVKLHAGSKVIGNVVLGNGVVVGAGAVVTKSFGDGAVVAGVPARQIKTRPAETSTASGDIAVSEDPEPASAHL